MKDVERMNTVIAIFLRACALPTGSDEARALFREVDEFCSNDLEDAWRFIDATNALPLTEQERSNLMIGPFENLLFNHPEAVSDRVIELAKRDRNFKIGLTYIYPPENDDETLPEWWLEVDALLDDI